MARTQEKEKAAVERAGVSRSALVSQLTKSPHGELGEYLPVGVPAAQQDPEFFAHLVAWNHIKGQVRDAKVALPCVALHARTGAALPGVLQENALAHLALLDPRNLLRAVRWALQIKVPGHRHALMRLVKAYLRTREANEGWWDKTALTHRASLKELYKEARVKPAQRAAAVLFDRLTPEGSVFEALKLLGGAAPEAAAALIRQHRLPWLVVRSALGGRLKDPAVLLAVVQNLSPLELVTNAAGLEKLGVRSTPELRAAFDAALTAATTKPARGTLKTAKAVAAVQDTTLKARLTGLAERQAEKTLRVVDGDWLVLADRSGSQAQSIEIGRQVAAVLAKAVKGQVHLVFFNQEPRGFDVTGKTIAEIQEITALMEASGSTWIGRALDWAVEKGVAFDGVALVSDGGESTAPLPLMFTEVYKRLREARGGEVPVYLYRTNGDPNYLGQRCAAAGIELVEFDLTGGVDWVSLPNLVLTMRASRYSLADEIMETPLKTLAEVLKIEAVAAV